MLAKKIVQMGYYWPMIERDCWTGSFLPPLPVICQQYLRACIITTSAYRIWPFSMWTLDVVGPLREMMENTNKKVFILTAIKHFTKWAEAEAYVWRSKLKLSASLSRRTLLSDSECQKPLFAYNCPQFVSSKVKRLCKKYKIELHNSSTYYPQGNGQVEASNKTFMTIIKKTLQTKIGSEWSDKLVHGLWAYGTSIQTLTLLMP